MPTISPALPRATAMAEGIPTVNPEIGGVYLGPQAEGVSSRNGIRSAFQSCGARNDFCTEMHPEKQLLFDVKSRFEVNPSVGGFLQSSFVSPADLGRRSKKAKGSVRFRPSQPAVIEELRASVTGYFFFSRHSGVVDAGTKAFALAEEATSQWL